MSDTDDGSDLDENDNGQLLHGDKDEWSNEEEEVQTKDCNIGEFF